MRLGFPEAKIFPVSGIDNLTSLSEESMQYSVYVVGELKEGAKEVEHDADVLLGKRKALQLEIPRCSALLIFIFRCPFAT